MNTKLTLTGLVLLAVFATPDVLADKDKSNSKRMKEARDRAELQVEHEQATTMRERDSEHAEQMREDAMERAEREREYAEERREAAMERAERERERAEQEEGFGGDLDKGQQNAASRGNEKSQEMRARRDERKRIKEEYDASGAKGRDDVERAIENDDDEAQADGKGKKPWWKFWGD